MLHRNLASVVDNYRSIDIDHFVVALALTSTDDVARLSETMGMPVRVVELTVPIDLIERRLEADPTTGRRLDLEESKRWDANSTGSGFSDLVVANVRPIEEVASQVLDWLGWLR
jgi:hypothetical protein